jgi:serine/threonine protein kinase
LYKKFYFIVCILSTHSSSLAEYCPQEVIAKGTCGSIFRCGERHSDKVIKIQKSPSLQHEWSILQSLPPHPNIIRAFDFGTEGADDFLVMQRWRDTLGGIRRRCTSVSNTRVPPKYIIDVSRQILEGLGHLHNHGITHRDVKMQNVLVEPTTMEACLSDFGLATKENPAPAVVAFQPLNLDLAPETLIPKGTRIVIPATDIWCFGCMVGQFVTGTVLFPAETLPDLKDQFGRLVELIGHPTPSDKAALGWEGQDIPLPRAAGNSDNTASVLTRACDNNADAADFILSCIRYSPAQRPTAQMLLQHKYLTARSPLKK